MSMRLGVFVTHPIQYFTPIWRQLAASPALNPTVYFFNDAPLWGGHDPGFQQAVKWDVPLLEGYDSRFLSRNANLKRPWSVRLPNAVRFLREQQIDAIVLHGYTHAFEVQVARAARRLGLHVVHRGEYTDERHTSPSWPRNRLRDVYLRWYFRHVDHFCYVGQPSRRHLLRLGISPERLFFSPYSVDSALFESQREHHDRQQSRSALQIGDDQFVVLFSGKFISRKDPHGLLDAIERLPNREQVTAILLGSGELHDSVVSRAQAMLGPRAILPGFVNQSQMGRYFTAADVFVLPSQFETWGLVVNEAMHFGLPVVVSSRVGCRADLVKEGATGFSYPVGNAAELAERLMKLQSNLELRSQMGAQAHTWIQSYSTVASANGLLEALGVNSASVGFTSSNRKDALLGNTHRPVAHKAG